MGARYATQLVVAWALSFSISSFSLSFLSALIDTEHPPPVPVVDSRKYQDAEFVVAIPHLVGNNMPPLQGTQQLRNNIVFVLANEANSLTLSSTVVRTKFISGQLREAAILYEISFDGEFSQGGKVRSLSGKRSFAFRRDERNRTVIFHEVADLIENKRKSRAGVLPEGSIITDRDVTQMKLRTFRSWLINRVVNATEHAEVEKVLRKTGEVYQTIPQSNSHVARATSLDLYLTNQNAARNFGIRDMTLSGAQWIAVIDGNSYFTDQTLLNLGLALIIAEVSQTKYSMMPIFRFVQRQLLDTVKKSTVFDRLNKPQILARQEAQLIFRYDAPTVYNETRGYGKNNKFELLLKLRKSLGCRALVHCVEGFGGGYSRQGPFEPKLEDREMSYCGAAFRLPYWTELATIEARLVKDVKFRRKFRKTAAIVLSRLGEATKSAAKKVREAVKFSNEKTTVEKV